MRNEEENNFTADSRFEFSGKSGACDETCDDSSTRQFYGRRQGSSIIDNTLSGRRIGLENSNALR